ncbi:ABC transporter permease [Nocardia farcinica]|uniref:ABC transporter permease n=1 Tax=Nocardia farcinica TaxID=37329 RepID=UPI001894FF6F|nr:ABC transporter permease [Nocardia farcinica]MBF6269144.1 ABC transporter permease [Nocardia farcinica]
MTQHLPTAVPHTAVPHPSAMRTLLDNRPSYLGFGAAWLLGHGAYALSHGSDPVLRLPAAVPSILLITGLVAALIVTSVVSMRAQRTATGSEAVVGKLLAASWLVGFGALFFVITAVSSVLPHGDLTTLLWPAGSGLIVGLLYLAGGAAYRDVLQYTLGAWLALTSTAALLLDGASPYWVLAVAGGGSYLLAAALEPRRRATAALA